MEELMKKKASKLNQRLLVVLAVAFTFVGLYFGSLQVDATESSQVETTVTGVQLRADVDAKLYFLVINTNEHAEVAPGTAVSNVQKYAKLLSQITLYTSKSDKVGISAAKVCDSSGWLINLWGSSGIMFPISESTYESTYNGSTVYAIKVLFIVIVASLGISVIVKNKKRSQVQSI